MINKNFEFPFKLYLLLSKFILLLAFHFIGNLIFIHLKILLLNLFQTFIFLFKLN